MDLALSAQEICLDLVAMVFLLSGCAKVFALRPFREGLVYIPLMPVWATYLVGWTLPAVELIVAAGLILNIQLAKFSALLLLAMFCAVVGLALWRRLQVPCGCFGGLEGRHLSWGNVRDNSLLALALVCSLPVNERAHLVQSLPVAGFLLLSYLIAHELQGQRRYLAGLRKQGAI
jgi:hypothetical protein